FAADKVLSLVREGVPFCDAYKKVVNGLDIVAFCDLVENILSKTHIGATGNLGIELSLAKIKQCQHWIEAG
ncbi:MAG TPA: hypothetical protein PLD88_04370, partial [Candidatus Berkiella sp.]|nr:hypothetical protein [Candidatus Berkiella sp.]